MLAVLEKHLGQHDWLVGERATIADLACYPYLMLAPDGGVDLSPYPGVRAWFERIERIPGYVPMVCTVGSAHGNVSQELY